MKQNPHELPVACRLTSAEFQERKATLLAQFESVVTATEELADGYAFRLPGDGRSIALAADLIAAEHECCPFMAFELAAHPNAGPVVVRMTGPAGTKEFLRAVLCKASDRI